MRIVAGQWRGRRIEAPPGRDVRPTLDRVREAWMSILQHDIPGSKVLDLFAGSGALGLEALSRGARSVDFVESDSGAIRVLRKNIETLGPTDASDVHRADALRYVDKLSENEYDIAFADPPYAGGAGAKIAGVWLERPFARILSVEHDAHEKLPGAKDTRRYGSSAITFYRVEE
ncbi:MAG TPA: 16S rRNA (guanine(966)-N(2))-methyltransferase RsmD [Gemmatimonadaceae bacterium]|nr:16S rRNA (guanine(966)-N(2))-methyltransferase RsmD [Gemmatimonadaceae bacterium]